MLRRVSSEASHLGLCGSPVLIRAAHVDAVVPARLAVASVAVSAEHAADDVPKMGHIVDIGQGAGDQNVSGTYMAELQIAVALLPTGQSMHREWIACSNQSSRKQVKPGI